MVAWSEVSENAEAAIILNRLALKPYVVNGIPRGSLLLMYLSVPVSLCCLQELFPGGYCPTPAHFFLKLLHDKGLLLSAFTQNIDGLEQLAGLPGDKVVPAHGSFDGERMFGVWWY
jgi:hypothetical protein